MVTGADGQENRISSPSQSSLDQISLASVASGSPPVRPDLSRPDALRPSSILGSPDDVSFNRVSQYGREFVTATMEKRIRETLVLCEEVAALAIAICKRGNDSADLEIAHTLDNCLYNLKIWVENVEAAISTTDVSSTSLRCWMS